jgi:hypothetical protein
MGAGCDGTENWSDGGDARGYRGTRSAREVEAQRTEQLGLGFHEVHIEVGKYAQKMVSMDQVDRAPVGYLEVPD